MSLLDPDRLRTAIAEAASVVDPQGENEDISLMAGLLAYAVEHHETFDGFSRETVTAAIRANWPDSEEYAEEQLARFEATLP